MAKNTRMSLKAIHKNIAYSKDNVTAYYYIPTTPFEFLDGKDREVIALNIDKALSALVTTNNKSIEGVLHVTSTPINTSQWAEDIHNRIQKWNPAPGADSYINQTKERLDVAEFQYKELYIGVVLGSRGSSGEASDLGLFSDLRNMANSIFSMGNIASDDEVSEKELQYWESVEADTSRILRVGALRAEPATPNQIAMLLKKSLFSNMTVLPTGISEREYWGKGEVLSLTDSHIKNNSRYLKITQLDKNGREQTGFKATLCFASFPEVMEFPENEPWIHYASILGAGHNIFSRFTLEPANKVRKQIGQKIQEIKDEADNAGGAGGVLPLGIEERFVSATNLEHELSKDSSPWVYARHRISVEAESLDELKDKAQGVIDHYKKLNIKVVWPSGDQFDLLLESQPGDKVRCKAFYHRQSLSIISGGMPTANSSVGDRIYENKGWIGWYLGYTTSRILEPVFFSPHVALARNSPPGILITGAPGGGKSFCAFTLTVQMALQGVWTIYIDPKADALPIKNLTELGNINVLNLREGNDGILDPWNFKNLSNAEKTLLSLETISTLLSGLDKRESTIIADILEDVGNEPNPSLSMVLDKLEELRGDEIAGSLFSRLRIAKSLPFARLCFSNEASETYIDPREGLTIVTLLGLDLPTAETPKADYSQSNLLAIAVMNLLTSLTRNLMINSDEDPKHPHPKAIVIDEAWAVMSTASGVKTVSEVIRMGRSLYCSLILISQNSVDFERNGLMNSIGTKLAFRAKSPEDIQSICTSFGVEYSDDIERTIKGLKNGECIMQDVDDRISKVYIESWNKRWFEAFDTNPETKGNKQKVVEV